MTITTHHTHRMTPPTLAVALLLALVVGVMGYQLNHNQQPAALHWRAYVPALPTSQADIITVDMRRVGEKNEQTYQQFAAFKAALADMRAARTEQHAAVNQLKPATAPTPQQVDHKPRESTLDLIFKIFRVLIVDEVTGLVQKAELVVEVGQHVADQVHEEE